MVTSVRPYTQQFQTPNVDFSGRQAQASDFGYGEAIGELGNAISKTADRFKHQQEQEEISDAQMQITRAQDQFEERARGLMNEAKPGQFISDKLRSESSDYFQTLKGNYQSQAAQRYVDIHGVQLGSKLYQNTLKFDIDLKVKDQFNKQDEIVNKAGQRIANGISSFSEESKMLAAEMQSSLGMWDHSYLNAIGQQAAKERQKALISGLADVAANKSLLDPTLRTTIVSQLAASQQTAGFESNVAAVLKREGGYVADDAGRGETNRGINKTAHPGVDIKGLTPEKAAEIYKRDYWDAYGIGAMKPEVQAIVFDGVINHGSEFKNKLVAAANKGASVQELASMRVAEYDRLIAANPDKYAKFEKSWKQRVQETASQQSDTSLITELPKQIKGMPDFYDALSPQKQLAYLQKVQQVNKQQQALADHVTARTVQDHIEFATTFGKSPPNQLKPSQISDPLLRAKYELAMQAATEVQAISSGTIAEQNAWAEKQKPSELAGEPGAFAFKMGVYKSSLEHLKQSNAKRFADPMKWAVENGVIQKENMPPVEFKNLGEGISARVASAEMMRDQNVFPDGSKPPPVYMTNQEANSFKQNLDKMTSTEKMVFIKENASKLDAKVFSSVLNQIDPGNVPFQGAAAILSSKRAKPQVAEKDSQLVLRGQEIMSKIFNTKQGEKDSAKAFNALMPKETEAVKLITEYLGQRTLVGDQTVTKITELVMAHYIGASTTKGINDDLGLSGKTENLKDNLSRFKKSFEAIVGKPVQYGDSKVIIPYGMNEAQFRSVVDRTVNTMSGGTIGRGEFSLVPDKEGNYRVFSAGRDTSISIDPYGEPNIPAEFQHIQTESAGYNVRLGGKPDDSVYRGVYGMPATKQGQK